jgi:AmmeMemoRadiSam system protein A
MRDSDRREFLRLAREHITAHIARRQSIEPRLEGELARLAGAFVTLHYGGDVRGCIGHIEANEPIGLVVARCATAACSRDPRLPSVTDSELSQLEIEISVLGALERVLDVSDIEVGRHGLVVERGWRRGLLLPQVAVEHHWDRVTFVEQTCIKAGLPKNGWRDNAAVWRFEAEVFSERELGCHSPKTSRSI